MPDASFPPFRTPLASHSGKEEGGCNSAAACAHRVDEEWHRQNIPAPVSSMITIVGDIFNKGTWKVTLKIYNLLQPPSTLLILSMDCRASPILSILLTRIYLSVNGVVL